jgi:hypothetical protein
MRTIEQEEVLVVLLERRKRLMEENELLEARRRIAMERPLPRIPVEVEDREERRIEADLIDIAPVGEGEGNTGDAEFTPFFSDTGASARDEVNPN